jgi:hypothetical protein
MIRVKTVEALDGFRVKLGFTDGSMKTVDLEPYLRGPVFEPLRKDQRVFALVRVDEELGTIVWPNGADIDPDVLYQGRVPASRERTATSGK